MRFLVAFARFWWDFVVGDDWRIAAGVTLALGLGAVLVAVTSLPGGVVAALVAGAIFATQASRAGCRRPGSSSSRRASSTPAGGATATS
jgi:hypothetical protein